jgi:hypothetical protein
MPFYSIIVIRFAECFMFLTAVMIDRLYIASNRKVSYVVNV